MPNNTEYTTLSNQLNQLDINISLYESLQDSIELVLENIRINFGADSNQYLQAMEKIYPYLPKKNIKQSYIIPYMSLPPVYSHVESQVNYMRFKQELINIGIDIAPWDNNKLKDQSFAKSLGFLVPEIFQSKCNFEDIIFKDYSVIKPMHGSSSRNVFYFFNEKDIIEVRGNRKFDSIDQLSKEINARKISGKWQVEQLIVGEDNKPAHDFKVYSYYGEIGCVLEVKREDRAYQCWYDTNGNILKSERYDSQPYFEGDGFDKSLLDYAKTISLAIPAPFMRVDFYKGVDDYYIGELTPHPGRYYPEYSPMLDEKLGQLFIEAEARLYKDLLIKKDFNEYLSLYNL